MIAALAREAAFVLAGAWCGVALLALAPLWGLAALRKGSATPAALPVPRRVPPRPHLGNFTKII